MVFEIVDLPLNVHQAQLDVEGVVVDTFPNLLQNYVHVALVQAEKGVDRGQILNAIILLLQQYVQLFDETPVYFYFALEFSLGFFEIVDQYLNYRFEYLLVEKGEILVVAEERLHFEEICGFGEILEMEGDQVFPQLQDF